MSELQKALEALQSIRNELPSDYPNMELIGRDCDEAIKAVCAAIEQASQSQWKPIETAPSGLAARSVLLYTPYGLIYVGRQRTGRLGEPSQSEYAWRCDSSGRFANPTHWACLPKAPKNAI